MPAADDDEGHADGDEAQERAGLEDVQEVVDAREAGAEGERREERHDDQDDERAASLDEFRASARAGSRLRSASGVDR